MKKLLLGFIMLFAFTYTFSQIEGTWKVAPQAGALGVGPGQGNISWWSNSISDVTTRACFFNDQFVFNGDGSFNNEMGSQTWLEPWQGVNPEACGTPIYPHDGSNPATWSYDAGAGTLTITGVGAHLGLAKVINGGELSDPLTAPPSITYIVTSVSATSMTLDIAIAAPGWWRFILEKEVAAGSDATLIDLQVDGSSIPGFLPNIENYTYPLAEGTVTVPQITTATPNDPGVSSIVITQATTIPGDATVDVTAADGTTTVTYTVSYVIGIPNSLPPIPPHDEADVISIYSDTYTNLPGTDFNPWWWQSTIVTVDDPIAGNNTLKYENLNYQGTEYTTQDVSVYEYLHVDFWTVSPTQLKLSLISLGPLETFFLLPATTGSWVSVDIPLSAYVPPVNLNEVFQFKVEGTGTVWLDNLYFWRNAGIGILTFDPQNNASNVAIDVNPTLSFTLPVEMANGSAITNGVIPSLITFKETDASGAGVPFTGTINPADNLITISPTTNLDINQQYYLALNNNVIRYQGGDLIPEQSVTFTTVSAPFTLPITFENDEVNYGVSDFGGNVSSIVVDPTDPLNKVVESTKGAETWAGTFLAGPFDTGLDDPIPFSPGFTQLSMRVWSPSAGTPVRFKVENGSDAGIAVETETLTTVNAGWETMIFDFNNEYPGTPAIDLAQDYHKLVLFFDIGSAVAGEVYYWDDVEFVNDPQLVAFNPANGSTNVPVIVNPTLTFVLPIEMANGSAITNSDIPSIITFRESDVFGPNVPFTGTIDAEKKVITIIPNSDLNSSQVYYLALNNLAVRIQGGALIPYENITFTTMQVIEMDLYDNFDDVSSLTWGYWDNNAGGILDVEAANPAFIGQNTSPIVAKYTKEAGSDPYSHAFAILGGKLDISVNNLFQMFIRSEAAGTVFALKLQNNDIPEPWTTEVTVENTIQSANVWQLVTFDFSPYAARTDLDKVLIMINPAQTGAGVHYFDEVYGPPFTPPAASPVVVDANVTNGGSSIEVMFDKDMEPEPGNEGNFNVYVDGLMNGITSTYRKAEDFTVIVLNLTTPVGSGAEVLLSYLMSGTVTSADNGILQPFQDYNVTNNLALRVNLMVMLEGPFNGFNLNNDLNPELLPLNQPYNTSPWNYTGSETVASIPNTNIVDWVMVEIRDTTSVILATEDAMVARQAAFLKRNGSVVGIDGASELVFDVTINDSMYVVIWHRNHINVMSSKGLVLADGKYSYNFTTSANKAYGENQKQISTGIWGMIAGNGFADTAIDELDKTDSWELEAGMNGYLQGDFNMDGEVNNQDKDDFWLPNFGTTSEAYQLIWQDEFNGSGAPSSNN